MTDLYVEKNHVHIDQAEMAAILSDLQEFGFAGEATEQSRVLKASWWVLVIHWVGDDFEHLTLDSTLTLLAEKMWRRYRRRGEDGPKRIDVVDATTLTSLEFETNEDGELDT